MAGDQGGFGVDWAVVKNHFFRVLAITIRCTSDVPSTICSSFTDL
jgi:hypothetical protein